MESDNKPTGLLWVDIDDKTRDFVKRTEHGRARYMVHFGIEPQVMYLGKGTFPPDKEPVTLCGMQVIITDKLPKNYIVFCHVASDYDAVTGGIKARQ